MEIKSKVIKLLTNHRYIFYMVCQYVGRKIFTWGGTEDAEIKRRPNIVCYSASASEIMKDILL